MDDKFEKGVVSVIMPTYNRAHVLTEALDSVWAQTYRPIELIVIDDGSSDGTDGVVERWRDAHQGDDKFELHFFRQGNSGAPSARNLGLIRSKGEYIHYLDSDDILYPTAMAQVMRVFEATDCTLVHFGCDKFCLECGRTIYSYIPEPETDMWTTYMMARLWGHTVSITRKRALAKEVGLWDEARVIDQDGDYLVRTILRSPRMAVIREPLFAYRVLSGPKITDWRGSREAWVCHLQRESKFCEGIKGKRGISSEARGTYAEQLYTLAVQLNSEGMPEIGDAFGNLGEGVEDAALTWRGRLMHRIWKSGRRACASYAWARQTKQGITGLLSEKRKQRATCPVCGR
jgi:glycosyltransferase involved in cell wall biosynthesis